MTTTPCSWCGAPVEWVVTAAGNRMPLDPEPRSDGNVECTGVMVRTDKGGARQVRYVQPQVGLFDFDVIGGAQRFVSHFATCLYADEHRTRAKPQPKVTAQEAADGLAEAVRSALDEQLPSLVRYDLQTALDVWRAAILDGGLDSSTGPARASDPSTSRRAATVASLRAGASKHKLGEVFYACPDGLTAEEAVKRAGLAGRGSPWHRVSDLEAAGILADTGIERSTSAGAAARVLAMTDRARSAWAARFEVQP